MARKPSFTKVEEAVIQDDYVEFKSTIEAPFSSEITKKLKDNVWQTITDRINGTAMSGTTRTTKEVYKKFKNMKTTLKSKLAAERKSASATGGGPPRKEVSCSLCCSHELEWD